MTTRRTKRHRGNGEGSVYYVKAEDRWKGSAYWTDAAGITKGRTSSRAGGWSAARW
jgi:hypothetical protein